MLFTRALFRRLKGLDYFDQILKLIRSQCPPAGGYESNEPNKKRKVSPDFPQKCCGERIRTQCPPAGGYESNEPNKKRKVSPDFPQKCCGERIRTQCPPAGGYESNELNKKGKFRLTFLKNVAEKGFEPMTFGL